MLLTMTASIEQFPVTISIRVAWGEMDAFAHLNNTVYFRYFESARIAYFEQMAILHGGGPPAGVAPILAATACRFRAPVTYPDTLRIGARVVEVGEDRFKMEYLVHSERLQRVVAQGEGVVVSFDYAAGRKTTLPEAWRACIASIEASG